MELNTEWLRLCPVCNSIYRANNEICPACGAFYKVNERRKNLEEEKVLWIINLHNEGKNRVEIAEKIDDAVYKNIKKSKEGLKTFQTISNVLLGKTFKEYSKHIISDEEWKIRRFWYRFHESYTVQGECWIWNGKFSTKLRLENIYIKRFIYENEYGKIEKTDKITSICGNACVNHKHFRKLSSKEFYSLTGKNLNEFLEKRGLHSTGPKRKVKLISFQDPSKEYIFKSKAEAADFLNVSPQRICERIKTGKICKGFLVKNHEFIS